MINNKSIIAIVPARSGSKGLLGKNIKLLCGKPLIAWSIEAGLGSQYIDKVVVSTDSEEILKIAKDFGAHVPFLRPSELATDTATSFDVIKHVIDYYKMELKTEFDYIVLLEPTSPARNSKDIDNAIAMLEFNPAAHALVGICKTESQNPAFLVKKDSNDFISGYENSEMKALRRQDIADVYFFEGSVYISKIDSLMEKQTFYHKQTVGFEMPKWKSLEIDDIDDFIMVEALMKAKGYCK